MKAANTDVMIRAGGHDDPRGVAEAVDDRLLRAGAVHVGLADPGHQEHLVVHGQPEHHADQEDRHEADDGLPLHQAERALLEDRDGRAERGQHREQEAQGCGQRHQDRAEDDHQQDERQPDHHGQVDRQRVGELLRHVGRDRGQAGDADRRVGLVLEAGLAVAELCEQVLRAGVVRAVRRRDQDLRAGRWPIESVALVIATWAFCTPSLVSTQLAISSNVVPVGLCDIARVDHHQHGRLATGSERVGDQVGRLALGGVARRRAVAREGEVHVAQRQGQGAEGHHDQQHHGDRSPAHEPRPPDAVVVDLALLVAVGPVVPDPATEGLGLQQPEESPAAGSARP